MIKEYIYKTHCPRCGEQLGLRPNASVFDPSGETYGCMLVCSSCLWNDWGHMQ